LKAPFSFQGLAKPSLCLLIVIALWLALGWIEFTTGFVEFSWARLLVRIALILILLPFAIPSPVQSFFGLIQEHKWAYITFLLALTSMGFLLFLSRYLRGANMGDTFVFKESIESTRLTCLLCNQTLGGTHFRAHNSLFLLAFVPLTILPNWWFLVQFLHSLVIVTWCRVCGWALGGNSIVGWVLTIALFLATYSQHASFWETPFAALGLTIFALGFYIMSTRTLWVGAVMALVSRETVALNLAAFGLAGLFQRKSTKPMISLIIIGVLWFGGSYLLMHLLGGSVSAGRFEPCLGVNTNLSQLSWGCISYSLLADWNLKLAYTLRLLTFAPSLGAFPSMFAVLPDLMLTWLSKDNVMYNMSWHYYLPTLGILLVGAGLTLRKNPYIDQSRSLAIRWTIAMALWQFATIVRLNLF